MRVEWPVAVKSTSRHLETWFKDSITINKLALSDRRYSGRDPKFQQNLPTKTNLLPCGLCNKVYDICCVWVGCTVHFFDKCITSPFKHMEHYMQKRLYKQLQELLATREERKSSRGITDVSDSWTLSQTLLQPQYLHPPST